MLSVILTILKIIGIILLVIIGLLLTVALTVLFVPIRYTSNGDFKRLNEGFKDNVSIRATWMFHILSVSYKLVDAKSEFVVKIFGRRLTRGTKKTKTNSKTQKKSNETVKKSVENMTGLKVAEVNVHVQGVKTEREELEETDKEDKENEQELTSQVIDEQVCNEKRMDNPSSEAKDITVENILNRNKDNKKKDRKQKSIKQRLSDIWRKINNVCQKIKNVKNVKDDFVEYLKKDESKEAIKELKSLILRVLKKILPYKLSAKLRFGFKNPAITGNVLGVASVFYFIYGEKVVLEPDFDNECLEGEYSFKGKIRVITLVSAALKIYRNRWLKKIIAFSKKTVSKI